MAPKRRPQTQRTPLKTSTVGGTERRFELSNSIRKARRSHVVSLKRRFLSSQSTPSPQQYQSGGGGGAFQSSTSMTSSMDTTTASSKEGEEEMNETSSAQARIGFGNPNIPPSSSTGNDRPGADAVGVKLGDLASAFVRAQGEERKACLASLQAALSRRDADSASVASLLKRGTWMDTGAQSLGPLLAEALAASLMGANSTEETRLNAARILTNLSATESGGDTRESDNYYGDIPDSWCDVLVKSRALSVLVMSLNTFVETFNSSTATQLTITLCEQCCWVLGNLSGDSQRTRSSVRDAGAIRPLIQALQIAFREERNPNKHHGIQIVGMARNAAWALSNLARGAFTSSKPFLAMGGPSDSSGLLSPRDLSEILLAPELITGADGGMQNSPIIIDPSTHMSIGEEISASATWLNVANEACWLLAFLTAREDECVDFLCGGNNNPVIDALSRRLLKASGEAESGSRPIFDGALQMSVPCIRAVGNIATAQEGWFVTALISRSAPIPRALAKIIHVGAAGTGDASAVAMEAAWAIGTLLCDVGNPLPHPATAACQLLVPVLCEAIVSTFAKLELKRECAIALLNAVAEPPSTEMQSYDTDSAVPDEVYGTNSAQIRDQILTEISKDDEMIRSLTGLLLSYDTDAVHAAVRLVNALLRRLSHDPSVRRRFDEFGCHDALEVVCDRISGESHYGHDSWREHSDETATAEIASDLIDDIFSDEVLERDEAATSLGPGKTISPEGQEQFTFALDFGNRSSPTTFDFGSNVPAFGSLSQPMGRGRGRGRGHVLPAWMERQQNS